MAGVMGTCGEVMGTWVIRTWEDLRLPTFRQPTRAPDSEESRRPLHRRAQSLQPLGQPASPGAVGSGRTLGAVLHHLLAAADDDVRPEAPSGARGRRGGDAMDGAFQSEHENIPHLLNTLTHNFEE